jgi:hypothetical protein
LQPHSTLQVVPFESSSESEKASNSPQAALDLAKQQIDPVDRFWTDHHNKEIEKLNQKWINGMEKRNSDHEAAI